ncbi:MAG TPA: DUF1295 domain-containing protein [Nevskiaceae bacterium]|nr:DUF1295 domain-containing protein [Nevskiaceae bacterium]
MSPLHAFALATVTVVLSKTLAWLIQLRTRNGGMVDPIWAFTLGALAPLYAWLGTAPSATAWALGLMGGLWGFRLGLHLFLRNWGKPEDWRYAQFRAQWGEKANANMFWFFQFQNLFTLMLSSSAYLVVAYRTDDPPLWAFGLALTLWLVSVVGEGVADRQMEAFRADPANRGQVCRRGLWRYSRHPNYFFECVHWLAYIPLAVGAPLAWTTLFAPLVMAFLLVRLSGMPLLEREMIQRKPGYAEYVRTTSALVPWFVKR